MDSEATSPARPVQGRLDDTSGGHSQEANTLAVAEQAPNSPIAILGANRDENQFFKSLNPVEPAQLRMNDQGLGKGMSVSDGSLEKVTPAEEADGGTCHSLLALGTGEAIHCEPLMPNATVGAHVEGTWR